MGESTCHEAIEELQIPEFMKAIRYVEPKMFTLVTIPVPRPGANEVLIKVKSCGICGSDLHIHSGDLDTRMPVITGHETSGIVVKKGDTVSMFQLGNKVTADNSELCGHCYYCRLGKPLYCENFAAHGLHRKFESLAASSSWLKPSY
ncbi:hypothetical protein Plec18167_004467 [Paecilomyces lecythidis]|uniref:Alcohol dehydrogenase-like N-terminal domain-containing protein n=1 Tax=Paecilomyces lecythidis TaxID=3004212 RepID=A0ABR3XQX4_9EURO